jgi:hypothetical protein
MRLRQLLAGLVAILLQACTSLSPPDPGGVALAELDVAFAEFRKAVEGQASTSVYWADVEGMLSAELRTELSRQRQHGASHDDINMAFTLPTAVLNPATVAVLYGDRGCLLLNGVHPALDRVSVLISYQRDAGRWLIGHVNVMVRNPGADYIREPDCSRYLPQWG